MTILPMHQGDLSQGKKCGLCCCASALLMTLIVFITCMSGYVHLGPDDQVRMRKGRGYEVFNGPGSMQLNPFKGREWRKATMLDALQYAVVQHRITSVKTHKNGPQLLFLGPDENLLHVRNKMILERDQYIRLVDRLNGLERVVVGPQAIVPEPTEFAPNGTMRTVFLTQDKSVIVLNRTSGMQSLITLCSHTSGVYAPSAAEEVLAERDIIHVLPHQAMIVRDVSGTMMIYSGRSSTVPQHEGTCVNGDGASQEPGGTAFFLPPYDRIVRMQWSSFRSPEEARAAMGTTARPAPTTTVSPRNSTGPAPGSARYITPMYIDQVVSTMHAGPKRAVVGIDLRVQKSFYAYQVRTNDNVKLSLEGTIFWEIKDLAQMISRTSDPEGDVWHHSRSVLVQVVSNRTLAQLMANFNTIMSEAEAVFSNDTFYTDRGITIVSMELTKYAPVEQATADVLQNIIRETTRRINSLQKQQSDNEVRLEKLMADLSLEANRTILIEAQALNTRLLAEASGATNGSRVANGISAFLDNINTTVTNSTQRLELFQHHELLTRSKVDAQHLSSGNVSLFVAPSTMALKLQMGHEPEL